MSYQIPSQAESVLIGKVLGLSLSILAKTHLGDAESVKVLKVELIDAQAKLKALKGKG